MDKIIMVHLPHGGMIIIFPFAFCLVQLCAPTCDFLRRADFYKSKSAIYKVANVDACVSDLAFVQRAPLIKHAAMPELIDACAQLTPPENTIRCAHEPHSRAAASSAKSPCRWRCSKCTQCT